MAISVQRARRLLAGFTRRNILTVGDLMLDHYIEGSVTRISPEAPVPVVHVNRERSVPGGASNVAANVVALGGAAVVAGATGRDAHGRALERLLRREGIGTDAIVRVGGHPTTVKTRVLAERQQAVRIDWERPLRLSPALLSVFCRRIEAATAKADAVVIEDYSKGVVRQAVIDAVLRVAQRRRIPVGLDPKDNFELDVRGVTLAKPNRKEAFAHAGVKDPGAEDHPLADRALLRVAEILMQKWSPRMLMITLGGHGMLLAEPGCPPKHVPTRAREVYDLSGAGDTVIATCMLALASGAAFEEAAELANYAAGVVVGKIGTATCSREELLAYMKA